MLGPELVPGKCSATLLQVKVFCKNWGFSLKLLGGAHGSKVFYFSSISAPFLVQQG